MDLVAQLATRIGIDPKQAEALAGGVMGMVKGAVAEEGGADAARELDAAVPEASQWQAAAAEASEEQAGGGLLGGLGGLVGQVAGGVGGQQGRDTAAFAALLDKIGLDAGTAAMAAPIVFNFLKERCNETLFALIVKAVPFLAGGDEPTPKADAAGMGGAVAGALGSFFGGKK